LARGTAGYRAPELLGDAKATFTTKADIWAIGCVLYRLVSGRKAFDDDWYAKSWSISGDPLAFLGGDPGPGSYKFSEESPGNAFLETVITSMLMPEPAKRPTAAGLLAVFLMAQNYFSPGAASLRAASLPPAKELNIFLEGVSDLCQVNHS
jgi:serine/threonine protein kinase